MEKEKQVIVGSYTRKVRDKKEVCENARKAAMARWDTRVSSHRRSKPKRGFFI